MSLKKQALAGVFWTGIEQVGTQIIGFIISVVLARLLLPEDFGIIGLIVVFVGVGNVLVNAGLTTSLIRSKDVTDEDYSTVFYFNLMGSIIIYIIVFFLAPYIANFYNQPILVSIIRWYTISFVVQAFSAVQIARLSKKIDFKTQTKVAIPSIIVGGSVGIFLAYKGYGVWSLVVMTLLQSIVKTIQLWIYSKWRPQFVFSKVKFYKHFNFGYKMALSGLIEVFFRNIYIVLIGKYYPINQVAYYQRANSLKQYPVDSISSIIGKVVYPLFSQIQDDNIRLKQVYSKMMKMVLFIISPLLIVLAVLATPLFRFLFTDKWLPAVPYFQILSFAGILYTLHFYNLNILNIKGRSDLYLKLESINKVIVLIIIFIAFKFGIYGLLYGSILASILSFFVNTYYSGRMIGYSTKQQLFDILPILLLSLLLGLIMFFVNKYLFVYILSDFFILLLGGILALTLLVLLSLIFRIETFYDIINLLKKNND